MADIAVTDAHALIWAATGNTKRLGRNARRFFEAVDAGERAVYVPALALVEIGEAVRRGTVAFPGQTFEQWLTALAASTRYIVVPLTTEVVLAGESLYAIPERGDRLIAATAQVHDYPLITRNPDIASAAAVPLIW